MGKLSEMNQAITDLHSAAVTINEVADALAEMFSATKAEATPAPVSPAEPILTLEQVRAVLAEKSRMGFTPQVRALLQKYGAHKLSAVDPANYESLMQDAEVLGNGS